MNKLHVVTAVAAFAVLATGVTMSIVTQSSGTTARPQAVAVANVNATAETTNTNGVVAGATGINAARLPEPANVNTTVVTNTSVLTTITTTAPVQKTTTTKKNVVVPSKPKPKSTNSNKNTNTSAPGEIRFSSYNTGYGWPDNTPPGGEVSNPILHSSAGGTGTYADPITLAVGHSIISGKDILDYPAGTKFYIPTYRRYFIVEDTCGDGNTPQNGPCHKSDVANTVQLDLWVGGQGYSSSSVLNCEEAITGVHVVIKNPAANYVVASGALYNGSCTKLYGDTLVKG